MVIELTSDFSYNGLAVTTIPLSQPREVEWLGITFPVDPGMVRIKDGLAEKEAPTCVLDGLPVINWDSLMTTEQIQERDNFGALLGPGLSVAHQEDRLISVNEIKENYLLSEKQIFYRRCKFYLKRIKWWMYRNIYKRITIH